MSNQLVKKNPAEGYQNVFPKTFIDAIKDKESGVSLQEILQGFNMYFLSYNGSRALTRCKIPTILRKEGLWITYVLYDHTVVTEWYNSDQIDDNSWSMDSNWRVASNNLVGDVSVSADGYWVINGEKTEAKAQGEQGVTPLLRIGANNKLQVSYNAGKAWKDISDYIVPRFRYTRGTTNNTAGIIQISMDLGKTWTNLSNEITNNLRISRYIGINESLPTSGVAEGTVYMKGPYYDEGDTSNANPIYRMWVYAWKDSTLAWQDNGEFTSISAGVVQERGTSTTEVMSQDAVTRELAELEQSTSRYEFGPTVRYAVVGQQINPPSYQYQDTMSGFETECKEGDVFTLTIVGGSSIRAWATIDANGVVKRVAREYMNGSVTPEIVTIEADEVLFVVNRVNAGGGYVAKTKGEDSIPMLKDKIKAHTKEIASNKTEIDANKQSIIELDKYEFTDTVRYAVVGNVLGNPTYQNGSDGFVTECKEGDKFILTIQAGSAFRGWATADASGIVKRVSKEYLNGSVTPVEVTIEKDEVTFIVNRVIAGGGYVIKAIGERTIPTMIEQIDTHLDSFNSAYANLSIVVDERGFVGQKENIQSVPLRNFESLLPNARMMTDDSAHLAFPSILYNSHNKILYLVYRKASAHIATDAQCVYKFSRDNGLTWSNEKLIVNPVKNGDAYGGEILAYPLLLDDGRMLFLSTYYECTENPSGEMDFAIAESYLFKTWIIGTNADGSLDVENAEVYTHNNIKGLNVSHLMVGGNGMYVGKTIYIPVYSTIGNTKSFIVKSNDGGKSFEYVGQISNTCNETAINIAGNRMIAVCRDVVDANNAHFYESLDMGLTWKETHRLDDNWHGIFLQKVFNNFIMIGRGGDLGRSAFVFMDEYGRYLHKPYNIGGYNESGYGAIAASYDYYHFVYYTNIGGVTTHPNVYYFRVPKSEIINEILN